MRFFCLTCSKINFPVTGELTKPVIWDYPLITNQLKVRRVFDCRARQKHDEKPHLDKLVTPDYVMLFIPMEGAFTLSMQKDKELFNFAWERSIVIVSPSTLLATLRTVASLWKQERQNKNAQLNRY